MVLVHLSHHAAETTDAVLSSSKAAPRVSQESSKWTAISERCRSDLANRKAASRNARGHEGAGRRFSRLLGDRYSGVPVIELSEPHVPDLVWSAPSLRGNLGQNRAVAPNYRHLGPGRGPGDRSREDIAGSRTPPVGSGPTITACHHRAIGAAILADRERARTFTPTEVQLAQGLALQAAVAIKNARLHALAEEERHLQKDFVLIGFGEWGQKAYQHLLTLKQFFNFRTHVIEKDLPGARERIGALEEEVRLHGDAFYWDSPGSPAHDELERELESSSYVITYIATPAATHLPMLGLYYDLSDVVLIEKPLGAPPEDYREFLDRAPGGVEVVAADHYFFKLEVRLLQMLLTEERTLRSFLDTVEEIRVEVLEQQPLSGAAADIGVIADLIPHAFAILSLLTPIDRIELDHESPLLVGRHDGFEGKRESYARVNASFAFHGRPVRVVIDVGKGADNAKWIKLSGERPASGRSPSYKFDFSKGESIDGTQATVRAAIRRIREPGVPDNAHLNMLRHVIEKRHPAVGILSIREAIRANQKVRELEAMAVDLLARNQWTAYPVGTRPSFGAAAAAATPRAIVGSASEDGR